MLVRLFLIPVAAGIFVIALFTCDPWPVGQWEALLDEALELRDEFQSCALAYPADR